MADEEWENFCTQIDHFDIWKSKHNSSIQDLPLGTVYAMYQSDMMMFAIWIMFDATSAGYDVNNTSWEDLYNSYCNTGKSIFG